MASTTSYFAEDGRVYARTPDGVVEAGTALSADGSDLERHDQALQIARAQRAARTTGVFVRTSDGFVTSYREAWKTANGRPVWTWRTDGTEPHDFGTAEQAKAWIDEVFHCASQKDRDKAGWTIEDRRQTP